MRLTQNWISRSPLGMLDGTQYYADGDMYAEVKAVRYDTNLMDQ